MVLLFNMTLCQFYLLKKGYLSFISSNSTYSPSFAPKTFDLFSKDVYVLPSGLFIFLFFLLNLNPLNINLITFPAIINTIKRTIRIGISIDNNNICISFKVYVNEKVSV